MRTLNVYKFNEKMPELGKVVPIIPVRKERSEGLYFYCGLIYNIVDALNEELEMEDDEEERADIKDEINKIIESNDIYAIEWHDEESANACYGDAPIDSDVIGGMGVDRN